MPIPCRNAPEPGHGAKRCGGAEWDRNRVAKPLPATSPDRSPTPRICLMGTHYHLVVETTSKRLSHGMQYLNGEYAQRFNRRHHRDGHVFGARFAAWVVRDDEHYGCTLEYVLTNPVRAGLVEDWTDWPWSGARGATNL